MVIKAINLNSFSIVAQRNKDLCIPTRANTPSFSGRDFHPVNSKREKVDFGNRLYVGVNEYFGVRNAIFRMRANAEYVNLSEKDLTNYCFAKSDLYKADLSNTVLDYANFSNCNLWGASLKGAKMNNTIFEHANLCDANFKDAKFGENTTLKGANIMGCDFSNTNLSDADLTNAIYNETTIFPVVFDEEKKDKMIFLTDGADFSLPKLSDNPDLRRFEYAKIRYLTVNSVNFENNSLKRIDFKRSRLTNCNFKNTEISRGYLKGVIAQNCDFSGAKLKQVNFNEAQFKDVNMSGSDLRGAILTYKSAENLELKGAIYDQYTKFNDGFNPKEYGMIYNESNEAFYNGALLKKEGR